MGYGNYSHEAHDAILRRRSSVPIEQVFQQQDGHPLMNPKGVRVRESRDSSEHPASLGVVFALDVTGSMGEIPKQLATHQLPQFMQALTACGIADVQVLFLAVGDATCDRVPLQVGQFESTAELMDQWLTRTFLEGGGGGQNTESYELALYFLAQHTEMDCHVQRGKRGYLFMTGDEEPYPVLSRHIVDAILGDRLDEDLKVGEIVAELQKSYAPFFLIPDEKRRARCEPTWRSLLGDHVLCMSSPADVCYVCAGALLLCEGLVSDLEGLRQALEKGGISAKRVAPVLRTLQPLAETTLGSAAAAGSVQPAGLLRRLFRPSA